MNICFHIISLKHSSVKKNRWLVKASVTNMDFFMINIHLYVSLVYNTRDTTYEKLNLLFSGCYL